MRISKDQIFSLLRAKGVRHLGEVKRFYSEADGHFSLFKFKEARPGLSVFPRTEDALPAEGKEADYRHTCCFCGNLIKAADDYPLPCGNCGNRDWMPAIQ